MFEFPNDNENSDSLPLDGFNIVGAYPHGCVMTVPTLYTRDGLEIRGMVVYDADFEEWLPVMEVAGDDCLVTGGPEEDQASDSLVIALANVRRMMRKILAAYNKRLRDDEGGTLVPANLN